MLRRGEEIEVYRVVVAIVAISSMIDEVFERDAPTVEDGSSGVGVSGDAAASCSVEDKSVEVTISDVGIKDG